MGRSLFSGGVTIRIITRIPNLLDMQWNEQNRAILDDVV